MRNHFLSVLSVLAVLVLTTFVLAGSALAIEKMPVAERGVPSDLYIPMGIGLESEFRGDDLWLKWRFKASSRLAENWNKGFVGPKNGIKIYSYVTYSPLVAGTEGGLSADYADSFMAYADFSVESNASVWHVLGEPGAPKSVGLVKPWASVLNGNDNAFFNAINGQTYEYAENVVPNWKQYLMPGLYVFNLCLEPIDVAKGLAFSEHPQVMPKGQGYGYADKLYGELIDYTDYTNETGVTLTYDANTGYTLCHGGKCWTVTVTTAYDPSGNTFFLEYSESFLHALVGPDGNSPTGDDDPDAVAIDNTISDFFREKNCPNYSCTSYGQNWSVSEGGADYFYTQFNASFLAQARYAMYCKTLPMVIDANGNYVTDKTYELSYSDAGIPAIASQEHGHTNPGDSSGLLEYIGVTDPRPFWHYSEETGTFNPFTFVPSETVPMFEPHSLYFEGSGVRSNGIDAFYDICKTLPNPVYDFNGHFIDQGPNALLYGWSVAGSGVLGHTAVKTADFNCDISPNPVTKGTTGDKIVVTVNGFNTAPQIFEGTFGIVWGDFSQVNRIGTNNPTPIESPECLMFEGGPCSDYMAFPEAGYVRPKYMK